MANKVIKKFLYILTPLLILILSIYISLERIPSTIFVRNTNDIKSGPILKLNYIRNSVGASTIGYKSIKRADVKLLGLFPLKSVDVKAMPEISIYPGGTSIGVKLNTKGVLVVALSDISGDNGKIESPAAQSGLMIGDNILKVNNVEVKNSETLAQIINESNGNELEISLERKGEEISKIIKPVKISSQNKYKIGLWVRDSTAGVGTLTFYDKKSKTFAALGHPVTDVDTGTILNIDKGELISSSIIDVRKGIKGTPGELKGIFIDEDNILGSIYKNTECGIFGKTENNNMINDKLKPMKVALRSEIKVGKAQIITTIDEKGPKYYNIEIEKLLQQENPGPKSMVIRITDEELLKKTGGIVQGMSGSPIIQDNKIVGAVTHVLINKPDTGYGIYIEWMLKDSEIIN